MKSSFLTTRDRPRSVGQKSTGGKVEVFFLEQLTDHQILAMTKGRLKPGHTVELPLVSAQLIERDEYGRAIFQLSFPERFSIEDKAALWAWLEEAGKLPYLLISPGIPIKKTMSDIKRFARPWRRCSAYGRSTFYRSSPRGFEVEGGDDRLRYSSCRSRDVLAR